jgi:hypothetical protein
MRMPVTSSTMSYGAVVDYDNNDDSFRETEKGTEHLDVRVVARCGGTCYQVPIVQLQNSYGALRATVSRIIWNTRVWGERTTARSR